jgi:hypothetical protein
MSQSKPNKFQEEFLASLKDTLSSIRSASKASQMISESAKLQEEGALPALFFVPILSGVLPEAPTISQPLPSWGERGAHLVDKSNLQTIALRIYGDRSLTGLIAQANNWEPTGDAHEPLPFGSVVELPSWSEVHEFLTRRREDQSFIAPG